MEEKDDVVGGVVEVILKEVGVEEEEVEEGDGFNVSCP